MKTLLLTTAALLAASAAQAQTAPSDHGANHAEHAQAAARPTIESSIEALENDAATKAVLEKHLPGLAEHPAYSQFKGMTLRQVAPLSGGKITDEIIAAIDADLKALPAH